MVHFCKMQPCKPSLPSDTQKLERIAASHALPAARVIGRFPTSGYTDFIWGGLIF